MVRRGREVRREEEDGLERVEKDKRTGLKLFFQGKKEGRHSIAGCFCKTCRSCLPKEANTTSKS